MTFHGLFWSAIIRSLLSLRRDMQLTNQADADAVTALPAIESDRFSSQQTEALLAHLIPAQTVLKTGQSLAGYFDFNKMGNLVVYMTSTRDIQSALDMLVPRSSALLPGEVTMSTTEVPALVRLSWCTENAELQNEVCVYFLLVLFRHLAGRRFDFEEVSLPGSDGQVLHALSNAKRRDGEQVSVSFSRAWLSQPSFFHSPTIESLLAPALAIRSQSFEHQLLHVFAQAPFPARIRAEWVAETLGMTLPSLRKTLKLEAITFSDLLKSYTHGLSTQRLIQGEKTDEVAVSLGFSDRRSFERSFKAFSGINAGQIRQLGARLRFTRGNDNLLSIVDNLPPLPSTIQAIVTLKDDDVSLGNMVALIKKDPIFHAHVMSKAGKAAFGGKVTTLEQAVGRNLGVGNIKNLAIMFAAQQQLSEQCRHPKVERLIDAMLFSDSVYSIVYQGISVNGEHENTRQQLLFGTLAVFLVFHEECVFADGVLRMWQESESFLAFTRQLCTELGICLYGASSLMLLRWGFGYETNQSLWELCKSIEKNDIQEVPARILNAHNIAFSMLASEKDYAGLDSLADSHRVKICEALEHWC